MRKILVLAIGLAIATGVSAAQFEVDLWGFAYVAEKDIDDSAFRLDDNDCRRDVTGMVYADAANGVNNNAQWTRAYIDCMEGKGYAVAPKKPE
jgi:hypothetical protein